MQVLLLNPPFLPAKGKFSREQRSPAITKSGTFYYPMWLSYATGVLEAAGFECRLIDAPASGQDLAAIMASLASFRPEVIVIDTSTPSIYNDIETAEILKEKYGAFIVLVGTHPSALPQEVLNISEAIDFVIRREYEYPLLELVQTIAAGKLGVEALNQISNLTFRLGGQIYHNQAETLAPDLDKIPFVSKTYKKHLNYHDYFYSHSKCPIVTIITGRGCPHQCVYCVYPQVFSGHKLRYRSIENVVDEIEYILKAFPDVKEIMFEDDTLTINKKRCFQLAEEILRRGLKFNWSANSRAEIDFETMKILRQAGARLFCVGIESGAQEVLDSMRKNLKVERIRQFFKDAKRAGILIHGCFLLGNPGETKETLEKTLQFAKELNPDTAQFFPIMVYPGTVAYDWARENGFLVTEEFEKWLDGEGMHNCVVSRPGLSNDDLVDFCDRARKEFYLRPTYIAAKLAQGLKDPYELKRLLKGGNNLIMSMLKKTFGEKQKGC